jgi:hypothetical protein
MDEGSCAATGAATSMPSSDPQRPPSSIDQPQRPLSTDMSRVCNKELTSKRWLDLTTQADHNDMRTGDPHHGGTPKQEPRQLLDVAGACHLRLHCLACEDEGKTVTFYDRPVT